jgi:hypothetical protein
MVRVLRDARVIIQPDDAFLVLRDFGAVVIVRFEGVRFQMPVNERMRVIGVGFVEVVRRHRGGRSQPRHKSQSDDGAPEPGRHGQLWTILARRLLTPRRNWNPAPHEGARSLR